MYKDGKYVIYKVTQAVQDPCSSLFCHPPCPLPGTAYSMVRNLPTHPALLSTTSVQDTILGYNNWEDDILSLAGSVLKTDVCINTSATE